MPTIVSFYQRFPNEAPPLNLSAFDRTGYTYAENFRRNERCYEAEQCEVTSDDAAWCCRWTCAFVRAAAKSRRFRG